MKNDSTSGQTLFNTVFMRSGMALVRVLLLLCVAVLLQSCAGLGVRSQAREEFDTGLALFNQGRCAEAIPHLDKATRLNPEFGKAYLYLGRCYVSLGKWKEALATLRTAYRLSPEETQGEILNILLDILFSSALSDQEQSTRDPASLLRELLNPRPGAEGPR